MNPNFLKNGAKKSSEKIILKKSFENTHHETKFLVINKLWMSQAQFVNKIGMNIFGILSPLRMS